MSKPTIRDVARAAGVSKGAVSFALNGRPGVAPETRERILEVARQLGWTPSTRARALSVSRALAVGLVVARPPETLRADPFFPAFIAGLESVLSTQGHALLLQVTQSDTEETYRRLATQGRVDGVFLTDMAVDDLRPRLLKDLELPAVVIGPALSEELWPAVGVDDAPPIREAVRRLIDLGHRRIAHVAGTRTTVHGRSRAQAWEAELKAAGLPAGQCVEGDFSAQSGAAATQALLDGDEAPTAIVYANDLMAMAGLSVAQGRGLAVPQDLSITGYDDTELAAHLQPPLTSVASDVLAWGAAAAQALLEVIDGQPVTPVDLPAARLVVRASIGPAPTNLRRTSRSRKPT